MSQINTAKKTVLANGVTILTKVNPSSDIVAFRLFLQAGPRYEKPNENGLSNMMLRLLQAGTKTRSLQEIAEAVDSIGADFNTDLNKDFGGLVLKTTRATFDQGLEILLDCLLNSNFPEDRFLNEQETILREIRQERDNILPETFRLFQQEIYQDHPYAQPALGTEETVSAFSRDDVIRYYENCLDPDRMLVVAVGNFDSDALIGRMKETLGRLPDQAEHGERALDGTLLPLPTGHRVLIEERESEAEWMVLGYLAPAAGSPDYAAMKVIDSIMGGSMNSRLFNELREKRGLAYQIGSAFPSRLGPSLFATYIGAAPENHDAVIKGILEEIERLKVEPVPDDELERAKTFIKGTFIMSQETNMGQASLYGQFMRLGLGPGFVDRYPELISSVTADKVTEVANKYLNLYTLTSIRPAAIPADATPEAES